MTTPAHGLSHRAVARHTTWNLAGYVVPLAAAFIALPPTIEHLGSARYGLFVLVMVAHDYFGYFDFGLGRATTRLLAKTMAVVESRPQARSVLITCVLFHLALGMVIGAVFAAAVPVITPWLVRGPVELLAEGGTTLLAASLFAPILLLLIATRGALEALQRFDLVNIVKIPANTLTFLIPLYAALRGLDLPAIVLGLVIMRGVTAGVYLVLCYRLLPPGDGIRFHFSLTRELFSFGGWIMFASLAGMLLVDGDRVLVVAFATMASLTYYSVPQDLVTRLWIVPASVASALFPMFALAGRSEDSKVADLYTDSALYLLLLLAPVVAGIVVLANPFLGLWMNQEFADRATFVLQVVAVGVLLDSVARIPLTYLQASGRPQIPARIRAWSVPPFVICSAYAIAGWGIDGAALVWAARIVVETVMLFSLTRFTAGLTLGVARRTRLLHGVLASGALVTSAFLFRITPGTALTLPLMLLAATITGFTLYSWTTLVDARHKVKLPALRSASRRE